MATPYQLATLAKLAVDEVMASNLRLKKADFVEVAAILVHAKHLEGNTEDQAKVNTEEWENVSLTWKARYRNLVREFLSASAANLRT
ncbi:MAG: hypothetical protein G01um101470_350 [Parcubacteria group bacterium Gr01-1014_70]|nr:MAG: hypothetical protein G01um101470_350 [Parcubacteria group bacterium Gr01-1014_70]